MGREVARLAANGLFKRGLGGVGLTAAHLDHPLEVPGFGGVGIIEFNGALEVRGGLWSPIQGDEGFGVFGEHGRVIRGVGHAAAQVIEPPGDGELSVVTVQGLVILAG